MPMLNWKPTNKPLYFRTLSGRVRGSVVAEPKYTNTKKYMVRVVQSTHPDFTVGGSYLFLPAEILVAQKSFQ